jgi:hypothetical protein
MPIDLQNLANNRRALSRENMAFGHKDYIFCRRCFSSEALRYRTQR